MNRNVIEKRGSVMGLTANSTGGRLLKQGIDEQGEECDYRIAIAGNPNVR